jgi:hypothetical protein
MKHFILFLLLFLFVAKIQAQVIVQLTLPDNCNVGIGIVEKNPENISKVSVYPNPNDGNLTLKIENAKTIENVTIAVYNSTGVQCYSNPVYCNSKILVRNVDVTDLSAGVYVIKVFSEEIQLSTSFIIQK